jgi:hypothetical protein
MTDTATPDDKSVTHPDPGGQIRHPVTGPTGQPSGRVPSDPGPLGPAASMPNAPKPEVK